MSRLVVLQTSPRVAPGLLTGDAWEALRSADVVLCGPDNDEQRQAIAGSGVAVDVVEEPLPALLAECERGANVVWLATPEGGEDVTHALASELVGRAERGGPPLDVEVLTASYDLPGARLLDLAAVMDRLREECPWDREQTHRSLLRYLVEEAYEVVEAVETEDRDLLREELGDLLLQVMFHARIASEHADDSWDVDDVAADIVEKLVRRHPHVFAEVSVSGVEDVRANWETLKDAEKGRATILEGIPSSLPALALAAKVLERQARRDGELPAAAALAEDEDLGEHLLSVVAAAQARGVDAEHALRDAVRRLVP